MCWSTADVNHPITCKQKLFFLFHFTCMWLGILHHIHVGFFQICNTSYQYRYTSPELWPNIAGFMSRTAIVLKTCIYLLYVWWIYGCPVFANSTRLPCTLILDLFLLIVVIPIYVDLEALVIFWMGDSIGVLCTLTFWTFSGCWGMGLIAQETYIIYWS